MDLDLTLWSLTALAGFAAHTPFARELGEAWIASPSESVAVELDHGETGCKTADAEPYILRAKGRHK